MFQNWGFLLGEIWGLILLAALLGLLAGWLIWNRSKELLGLRSELDNRDRELAASKAKYSDLKAEYNGEKSKFAQMEGEYSTATTARDKALADLAALKGELATAKSAAINANQHNGQVAELTSKLDQCRATVSDRDATIADLRSKVNNGAQDFDGDGIIEGKNEGSKPQTLMAARDGKADDLKMIKGVGPKLEKLLHSLGFYHFDQVASWSDQEVAWVDANLEGFTGRVSRDRWIEQAKILAAGGTTEFAGRVEDGGIY